VGNIGGVYNADLFEIEEAVETPYEGSEYEEFSQRRMDIDLVLGLE
jgi:hypothetical protein